jgi:peroxiredoxin
MQRVYDYYKESGLEIYAISNLQQDSINEIQSLAETTGIQFPVLLDKDGSVFDEFLIRAIPTTLLVDSNGRVLKVFYGGPLNEIILSREINISLGVN